MAKIHNPAGLFFLSPVKIGAPPSEKVSSSLRLFKTSNAHAQPFSGARDLDFDLPYVYIMFPATTAAQNVAHRGILSLLSWYSSSGRYHYVFSRSVKVSVTTRGLKRAAEPRRPDGALRLSPRSVTDACTFPQGLSHSDGTSHVLLLYNQGLLRLSSSVKANYG